MKNPPPGNPQHCPQSNNPYGTHGVNWDGRTTITKRGGRVYTTGTCNKCHTPVEAEDMIDDNWNATNTLIEEDPW